MAVLNVMTFEETAAAAAVFAKKHHYTLSWLLSFLSFLRHAEISLRRSLAFSRNKKEVQTDRREYQDEHATLE